MRKAPVATFSILALAATIVVLCHSRAETMPPPPGVAVYFAPSGEDRRIHQALQGLLESAKREVVIAVYQFTSPDLGKLVNKVSKRVRVRILIDEDQAQGRYSQDAFLKGDGIELKYVRLPGSGAEREKFHHKFCVIDGETVATGSFNWTVMADEKNYENLLVLRDPSIARQYVAEFDRVWNDANIAITK